MSILRRLGVHGKSRLISKAPVSALAVLFPDRKVKSEEQKAKDAEHYRDNAVRIYKARARQKTAANQAAVAQAAYGFGAIDSDKQTHHITGLISASHNQGSAQQLCSIADQIAGEIAGSALKQIQGS